MSTGSSFPLPPNVPEPVDIETCACCRGLCSPGDVDAAGVCTDCREISARTAALNKPARRRTPPPADVPFADPDGDSAEVVNGPSQWWNRD